MGYKNISLDLMIAIPGRDNDALQRDIDTLIELAPEHASAYALELDEGAPLRELRDKGLFTEMNEEQAVEQFELLHEKLDEAGIHPYEISNFSKPGFESKHNQHYWDAGEYYGCGPSASGHIDGVRTQNIPSLPTYIAYLQRDRSPISEKECLEPEAKARESLMLALRCRNGIRNEVFESRTGFSYGTLLGEQLDIYIAQGLMELHEGNLRLTQKALFISDSIFSEFI
jgi:oxygen-independent coproporphyrinogen-3 oxidase